MEINGTFFSQCICEAVNQEYDTLKCGMNICFEDPYQIPNPMQYISQNTLEVDSLKNRIIEWKKINKLTNEISELDDKISECEQMLELIFEIIFSSDFSLLNVAETKPKVKTPKEPWEKLKNAFDRAKNPEKMMNLLQQFLKAPENFSENRSTGNGEIFLKGFSFSECNCGIFGRSSSNIRQNAELTIINFFVNHYPDKEKQLHIASIGSGGMLQDLVIIGKLVMAGFKNIKLCCIDSVTPESQGKELEAMMNKLPGVLLEVNMPNEMFLYRKRELFDGIYAIDFDDLNKYNGSGWRTILGGQNSLKSGGKMFLYGDGTQAAFQKDGTIENLDGNPSILEQLMQNGKLSSIQQAEEVFITMTKEAYTKNFKIPTIVSFLQLISQGKEKKITLQLFGNELKGVASTYKLEGYHYAKFIEDCSKVPNLTVSYSSDKLSGVALKENSIIINEKGIVQI